jgi:beta-glucanase (GH16 family)
MVSNLNRAIKNLCIFLFAAVFMAFSTCQSASYQGLKEIKISTVRNSTLINGFASNAAIYDLVDIPEDGRTNVVKINGKDCSWNVLGYSLADYRNKPIAIHFSADVMRIGAGGPLLWTVNNEPDYLTAMAKNNAVPGVWYRMSRSFTVAPANINTILYLSTWNNDAKKTAFYFDNLSITINPIVESDVYVYPVKAPVAGNYPQGLFRYPYRTGFYSTETEIETFGQTLEYYPAVTRTFAVNTQYTAIITLEPTNRHRSFKETTLADLKGLPTDGIESIRTEIKDEKLIIYIVFQKTQAEKAAAQIIFEDEFNGTLLDAAKWEPSPEWDTGSGQGRSSWRSDLVSVSGGYLHIKFIRDSRLGRSKTRDRSRADNWIRSGAIASRKQDWPHGTLHENSYGYYEARIKFPVVRGTWGAFWLMSPTQDLFWYTDSKEFNIAESIHAEGMDGTEIDIVESIGNHENKYSAALHWNGYGTWQKSVASGDVTPPVNIYDNEFHIFALDWSPSEYVFYVDGREFWRVDGGDRFNNSGINQNPNYICLSVEGAVWAGLLPPNFSEDEMLVDYVRIYNQPQIGN